jgi:hypothetical protein
MRTLMWWLGFSMIAACGDQHFTPPLVVTADEPPGLHCADGGVHVTSGLDSNNDAVLETSEVTSSTYVCSQAGSTTLVRTDDEPAGANCPTTGTAIHTGVDANHDGVLQDSEIQTTTYVCSSTAPATTTITGTFVVHNLQDAFDLVGVTDITGNLEVDAAGLTQLDVATLRHVGGAILVSQFSGTALDFTALETAGALLVDTPSVTSVTAPKLTAVDGLLELAYGGPNLSVPVLATVGGGLSDLLTTPVSFPALTSVAGDVRFSGTPSVPQLVSIGGSLRPLTSILLPSLVTLGGDGHFPAAVQAPVLATAGGVYTSTTFQFPALAHVTGELSPVTPGANVAWPSLQSVGSMTLVDATVATVALPALTSAGTLWFGNTPHLTNLELPSLTTVTESLIVDNCGVTTMTAPNLVSVGTLELKSSPVTAISLPALTNVAIAIDLESLYELTSISLPHLQTIGPTTGSTANTFVLTHSSGNLTMTSATLAVSIPSLTHVYWVDITDNPILASLDAPLLHSNLFYLQGSPHFPDCQGRALYLQSGATNGGAVSGLDTNATCP